MRKISLLTVLVLLFLFSCNLFVTHSSKSNVTIELARSRSLTVSDIASMELTVSGSGMDTVSYTTTASTLELSLPQGDNRTFSLTVTLINGMTLSGKTTSDITGSSVTIIIEIDDFSIDGVSLTSIGEGDFGLQESLITALGEYPYFAFGSSINLEAVIDGDVLYYQWLSGPSDNRVVELENSSTINLLNYTPEVGAHIITFRAYYKDRVAEEEVEILIVESLDIPVHETILLDNPPTTFTQGDTVTFTADTTLIGEGAIGYEWLLLNLTKIEESIVGKDVDSITVATGTGTFLEGETIFTIIFSVLYPDRVETHTVVVSDSETVGPVIHLGEVVNDGLLPADFTRGLSNPWSIAVYSTGHNKVEWYIDSISTPVSTDAMPSQTFFDTYLSSVGSRTFTLKVYYDNRTEVDSVVIDTIVVGNTSIQTIPAHPSYPADTHEIVGIEYEADVNHHIYVAYTGTTSGVVIYSTDANGDGPYTEVNNIAVPAAQIKEIAFYLDGNITPTRQNLAILTDSASAPLKVYDVTDPVAPVSIEIDSGINLMGTPRDIATDGSGQLYYMTDSFLYKFRELSKISVPTETHITEEALTDFYSKLTSDEAYSISCDSNATGFVNIAGKNSFVSLDTVNELFKPLVSTGTDGADNYFESEIVYLVGGLSGTGSNSDQGLTIIDTVTNGILSETPLFHANKSPLTSNSYKGVKKYADYLIVADDEGGLKLFNVSKPITPTLDGEVSISTAANDVDIIGHNIFVTSSQDCIVYAIPHYIPLN